MNTDNIEVIMMHRKKQLKNIGDATVLMDKTLPYAILKITQSFILLS